MLVGGFLYVPEAFLDQVRSAGEGARQEGGGGNQPARGEEIPFFFYP